jgi:uncharacterized membrane protein (UPF0127 family)
MRLWKWGWFVATLTLALLNAGCKEEGSDKASASQTNAASASTASATAATISIPPPATQAQPKLATLKLWIGPEELITEIASTEKEVMTGMMHRTTMAENEAMLFVFAYPHQAAFWMKNTILPLSCAYIDPDGIVLETHDMKPLDENPIKAATNRVQYVLEVKQGWFDRHNIKPGALVRTERGTLAQTFFGRGQ